MKKTIKKCLLTLALAALAAVTCAGFAACRIIKAESITFSETEVSLDSDGTHELTYTVQPENATVKVEISDKTVVNYENGTLTALTAGEATVKVYSTVDKTVFAECNVTVAAPDGFTAYTYSGCKFVYPSSWRKNSILGVAVNFVGSNGSNINLVTESKNNSYFNANAAAFKNAISVQFGNSGYSVTFTNCTVEKSVYLGYTRVHVVYDYTLTKGLISVDFHQEQMVLNSGDSTYILTVTYSDNNFNQTQNDTVFSQFIGLN